MKTIYAKAAWSTNKRSNDKATPMVTPELAMVVATSQRYHGWYLPTEVVLSSPQHIIPMSACYFSLYPEEVRSIMGWSMEQFPDYIERTTEGGMVEYRCINQMYLIERHADHGDDGHTHYRHTGYALLTAEDFEVYLDYEHACNDRKSRWDDTIEEVRLVDPKKYCYSCDTVSDTDSWVGDTPDSYPRCPICTMC